MSELIERCTHAFNHPKSGHDNKSKIKDTLNALKPGDVLPNGLVVVDAEENARLRAELAKHEWHYCDRAVSVTLAPPEEKE